MYLIRNVFEFSKKTFIWDFSPFMKNVITINVRASLCQVLDIFVPF